MSQANIANKDVLRAKCRLARNSLTTAERTHSDRAIRAHLGNEVGRLGVTSLAAFWPFDGEPDLVPALRELASSGIHIALPVLSGNGADEMQFHAWHAGTIMRTNRFGIPEPLQSERRDLQSLGLLLLPLTGWDRRGNRLGMGSGYYDRALRRVREYDLPLRVGVAYGCMEVEQIPDDQWDVPLHGVLTEQGWFTFAN